MFGGTARHPRALAGAGALTLALVLAATALAAVRPHPGRYAGFTSATAIDGFKPPVGFTLSSGRTTLTAFKWASIGCFGAGGFRGDPWTGKGDNYIVATIPVSHGGTFSVKNAKSTYTSHGYTTVTTMSVSGRFTGARSASGTITYSQKLSGPQITGNKCGPGTVSFSARAK
jgi:hypothetical protein